MSLSKRCILLFFFSLFFSHYHAQINLKKTKSLLNSKKNQNISNPCNNNGTVTITQASKAFTMYKNVVKQIELAESFVSRGLTKSADKNIANAERYLGSLLKKEPNADLTELCNRISSLKTSSESGAKASASFSELNYFLSRYYSQPGTPAKPERFGWINTDFKEKALKFNRSSVLSQASGSSNPKAKELISVIEDYSAFIDREGVVDYLMNKLDEVNNASGTKLYESAITIKKVAEGLKNIAGSNDNVDALIAYADKQIGKADSKMAGIYTSEFHKDNVNKVVFTKKPFKPGNESTLEINPVFKAGDAIYATIYLSASIKDAVNSWKGYGKGGNMGLYVENSRGDYLNMKYESWEVSSYSNSEVTLREDIDKSQSFVQFLLIPNLESDLSQEIKYRNISPILMARGLSFEPERQQKFTIEVKSTGKVTGPMVYKGSFKIDLGHAQGSGYYSDVDKMAINKLLEPNPLPTAKIHNSGLESQLLAEMNKQGFQERYKKTYIQTSWKLFKPISQAHYKEMQASFTYSTSDGKCGWQTYSFRSFEDGNGGWTAPQKWGGADQRERISCNKL